MKQNSLKKVIYFLLALVPLTIWHVSDGKFFNLFETGSSGLFFPFISGKNLLFRFVVDILFVVWLISLYNESKITIAKTHILFSFLCFGAVMFIADLFGVNSTASFFSGFERMEGFLGLLHYILYFLVLVSVIKENKEWNYIAKWFFISNILVGLWGFFQFIGFYGKTIFFSQNFPLHQGSRIDSTLGNPAYFAIFSLYFVFLSLFAFVKSKVYLNKILFSFLAIFNVFLLYYAGTRSAVLGLVAGVFVAASAYLFDWKKFKYEVMLLAVSLLTFLYSLFWSHENILYVWYFILFLILYSSVKSIILSPEKVKKMAGVVFVVVIVSLIAFTSLRNSAYVMSSPLLNRFASISVSEATGGSRIMVWKMSLQGFKERPILGWGQDNFPYVFAKYQDPKMFGQEPWFDRSHNVFFDWLIAGGILGLITHLSLYFFGFYLTLKAKALEKKEKALIYGMLIAQFVNNLFIFDNLASYILFFTLLAYISSMYALKNEVKEFSFEKHKEWMVPLGIIFTFILSLYSVIFPYFTNSAAIRGMKSYQDSPLTVMEVKRDGFEQALSFGYVGIREIKEQFVGTALMVLAVDEKQFDPKIASSIIEEKNKWYEDIITLAKTDLAKNNGDLRPLELYGDFYLRLGDLKEAEKILTDAHTVAPKRQRTSFNLIQLYLLQGNVKDAFNLSKETYKLAPEFDTARKAYASIALRMGEREFKEVVNDIHNDKQKLVYPPSLKAELVGVKDKEIMNLYINSLKADYPEKAVELTSGLQQLISQK